MSDPVLVRRRANEARFLAEVSSLASRVAVVAWTAPLETQRRIDFFAAASSSRGDVTRSSAPPR